MADNTIAKAYVQIIPTTKGIQGQLEKEIGGADIGQNAGKSIAGGIGKGLAAATGLIATGVAAVSGAIVKGVKDTAEYADNIDKMSQKLGLSAQAYQEWDFIAQHSGTNIDGLQAGMKTLANAAENNSDAFAALGLSMSDIKGMSQEDLFGTVVERLQSMGESTERTAVASKLLGRSATELAPLLNTSAQATAEMRQQAHDLGGVLSNESVKAGAAFQDSLQNMQTAFGGLKNQLAANFLPAVTDVMDGLAAVATGDNSGLGKVNSGINDFLTNLISSVPKVADTAVTIVTSILETIVENLPKIIDSGFDILMKLIEGIVKAIPKLIEMLPTIITKMITTLSNNLPKIISMGGQLLVSLINGLIKAIPQLIKNIPQIISALVNGLSNGIQSIRNVGANLVRGLWNGISDMVGWVLSKIRGFGQTILNGIKGIFGIHSPSTETAWMGDMLMQGLANGIDDNAKKAVNSMKNAADSALGAVDTGAFSFGGGNFSVNGASGNAGTNNITLNVYGAQGQDVRELANIVMAEIQGETERKVAAFA